jgi:hypothetical protein
MIDLAEPVLTLGEYKKVTELLNSYDYDWGNSDDSQKIELVLKSIPANNLIEDNFYVILSVFIPIFMQNESKKKLFSVEINESKNKLKTMLTEMFKDGSMKIIATHDADFSDTYLILNVYIDEKVVYEHKTNLGRTPSSH